MSRKKVVKDVLSVRKLDRRILSHAPDPAGARTTTDRRYLFAANKKVPHTNQPGRRYIAEFPVHIRSGGRRVKATSIDISQSGILVKMPTAESFQALSTRDTADLRFQVPAGAMEEGMERKRLFVKATQSRLLPDQRAIAYAFEKPLSTYFNGREKALAFISFLMLLLLAAIIILMRSESLLFFRFQRLTAVYSVITGLYLLSRYLFGSFYRPIPVDRDYTPGVTIIIPCYNEAEWIDRTITYALDQDYPVEKLEVIVIDDFSTDPSVKVIEATMEQLFRDAGRYDLKDRLRFLKQERNMGKREAMARGAKAAKHELVVFVDSDSFLEPDAIRNLVQPMKDDKVAGVSGRTDVANTFTNTLTKMQSVRYYVAFRVMKAAESIFDGVTCLSGPLSCYRKSVMLEHLDGWLNQRFLGNRATFGDDRSMTNFMLRHHRTVYQDTAVAFTIVPNTMKIFLRQQMRWKRSWLRETFVAASFMWRKEPFMALSFYAGMLITIASPIIVLYNFLYVPIVYNVFPTVFVVGILIMSMMMSMAQLFLRKSSTWIYGVLFNLFYVAVLIWQMPIAWFTFWKSDWGTRGANMDSSGQQRKAAA